MHSNNKLYYSTTNRDNSQRIHKSPESKSQGLSFVGHQPTKSYGIDMISPTCQSSSRKEFTSTLRQGNKSSSKVRLRSANSFSLNTIDNNDLKFNNNIKLSQSREKSRIMSSYGDNSIIIVNIFTFS